MLIQIGLQCVCVCDIPGRSYFPLRLWPVGREEGGTENGQDIIKGAR